jgi:exonuclease SbcC
MTGNVLSVRFVLDKTLKTKKEVVTLDVVIDDNRPGGTGSLAYLSRSGGEKVKASLAVILALAELKASQNGIQLGFLFIDEPPFLDASGISAYCDALDVIGRRYPALKIMAITHDENMKSRFPQHIAVIKENDGSHFSTDIYGAFSNNAAQERKEYLEQSEPIKRSRRTKTATA